MNAFFVSLLVALVALSTISAVPLAIKKVSQESEEKDNVNESATNVTNVDNVSNASNASNASNVTKADPDMAQAMWDLLTSFQRIMPCGDEDLGIPVMAPFRLGNLPINVNEKLLTLEGKINNLVISGINEFVIIELAGNSSSNRTNFDVLYKGIQMLGEFNLNVDADIAGYRFVQKLEGLMDLQVLNIRVTGELTVGVNKNGGMLFSDIRYYVQVGDIISNGLNIKWSVAVNNFVNQYLRDSSLLFLETNRSQLSEIISGYVTPMVNNAFQNISASDYLQGMVEATQLYNSIKCSP